MNNGYAASPGDSVETSAFELVRRPLWIERSAKLLAVFLFLLPVFLIFVPWQQNVPGVGRVVAYAPLERQQTVEAPIGGRVVRWWVQEGSTVIKGDPLVEISDIDPDLVTRLDQEKAAIHDSYRANVEKVRSYEQQVENLIATRDLAVAMAQYRVEMAKEKVKGATAGSDAARASLKAAEAQFGRHKNLLTDGIVSRREYEVAERDLELARTSTASAVAALEAAKGDLSALQSDLERTRTDGQSKIDSARATLSDAEASAQKARAELAKIDVGISRQRSQRVFAPRDGTVFRLIASQDGEIVKPGDPLMILVPQTSDRAVELWVDGNDTPLVQVGSHVRLQFEGWPAVQFVGWPSVAVGTFGGLIDLIDTTDNGMGQFRVLIRPNPNEPAWPDQRYLRQGVRTKGWVLLNRVRLGYEAWRQINGFPPVISLSEPKSDGHAAKGPK